MGKNPTESDGGFDKYIERVEIPRSAEVSAYCSVCGFKGVAKGWANAVHMQDPYTGAEDSIAMVQAESTAREQARKNAVELVNQDHLKAYPDCGGELDIY